MREWFIVWGVFLVFIGSNRAEGKGKPVRDACSRPGLKGLSPESDLMNSVPDRSLLRDFRRDFRPVAETRRGDRLPPPRHGLCRRQRPR